MNRTIKQIMTDIRALGVGEPQASLRAELAHVRTLTLNEMDYGCKPEEMGTTGLMHYVRGPFWPFVPESTCYSARIAEP